MAILYIVCQISKIFLIFFSSYLSQFYLGQVFIFTSSDSHLKNVRFLKYYFNCSLHQKPSKIAIDIRMGI